MAYNPVPPRHKKKSKSKANIINSLFAMLLGIISLSTDAFGTLPPSELSKNFRETLGEMLPAELVEPINSYLAQIPSSPLIPLGMEDAMIEETSEEDLNDLAQQIAEEMAADIVAEQGPATAEETPTGQHRHRHRSPLPDCRWHSRNALLPVRPGSTACDRQEVFTVS